MTSDVAEAVACSNVARATRAKVTFLNAIKAPASAERDVAAWLCQCGDAAPLIGRCDGRVTVCASCNRRYRVIATQASQNGSSRARGIEEVT